MQKIEMSESQELRGFKIKLYPTAEQVEKLACLEAGCRSVWNQIVAARETSDEATVAYAVREGLVSPRPVRPSYDGLTPDDSAAAAEQHRDRVRAWWRELRTATKGRTECASRNLSAIIEQHGGKTIRDGEQVKILEGKRQDYQALKRLAAWSGYDLPAHLLQHLAKNYIRSFVKGRPPPRRKKSHESMPIGVRSGESLFFGDFGTRGGNQGWYNCEVRLAGLKIRGRLPGRKPAGRVLEGVSIVREAGAYYASVRVVCEKRVLPAPIPGSVVGIDVGLDNLAALSDGTNATPIIGDRGDLVLNPRNRVWDERVEAMRRASEDTGDRRYEKRATREEGRMARRVRHQIYNEILKRLAYVETIVVEELTSRIGQMGGSRKVSAMRLTYALLKERFGDRVREVRPEYTSQDCSRCGVHSKESWSYDHGPMGCCGSCGHQEHRDINAARNIADKYVHELRESQ